MTEMVTIEPVSDVEVAQATAQLMSVKLAKEIDEFCELKTRMARDEKRLEELLKTIAPAITETVPLVTSKWCLTKSVSPFDTLDVKALKAKYSAKWVKKWTKKGTRTTYKPTALVAVSTNTERSA